MRWLVEVTSLGKDDRESLHVEAETWQKALQVARTQRGEGGPMSGFSIELLDEGCRAVDPVSRLRYEVRRAAASMAPPAQPAHTPSTPPRPASNAPPAGRRLQAPTAPTMMLGTVTSAALASEPAATPPEVVVVSVPSQVIFRREQEATEALPLTYREYVFAVHPGTTEAAAESVLRTQFELVRTSLERVPAGKLVNLAVFDLTFQGRPPVPPLATLTWKDWRGPAVVAFPRRAAPAPAPIPVAPSAPPPSASLPITMRPSAPPLPTMGPPSTPAQPPAPTPAPVPVPVVAPVPAVVAAPPSHAAPAAPAIPVAAVPMAAVVTSPFAPAVVATPGPVAASAPAAAFVPAAAPGFAPPPEPPPAAALRPSYSFRAQPSQPAVRVRGEDLIADLFEAMHDLNFARDAIEGGEFCLVLAMEKLPCQAALVHLYDIDRREFVIAGARGNGTGALLLMRSPEGDPLLATAMRKRTAVVLADAAQSEAAGMDRYAALGGARSLITAPVMLAGRFLGAIELLNPLDGQPFTDSDGNAVTYIAEQFAEFVATRGVVLDPERIGARRSQEG